MNLLFDLDGTLTDPQDGLTKSVIYALKKVGHQPPPPHELLWFIGPPVYESFLRVLKDPALAQKAVEAYREHYDNKGIFESRVYDGIPQALTQLKEQGHKLYIASSKLETFANRVLNFLKFTPLFDGCYGSEPDGTRADKGALISYILEKEKLDRGMSIVIGDRKHDMLAAKINQLRRVGVGWGHGSEVELLEAGAESIIQEPEDLPAYFL